MLLVGEKLIFTLISMIIINTVFSEIVVHVRLVLRQNQQYPNDKIIRDFNKRRALIHIICLYVRLY